MKDLIIDDFPDDLYDRLCLQAEKHGRRVSDEALILLTANLRVDSTKTEDQAKG